MGGRSSRTKGHAFERYIAQRLRPYDEEARRNVAETQVASVDIITSLPFGIQCKRLCEWPNPSAVYMQACIGTRLNGVIPMGIVKVDREERIVAFMSVEHFRILFHDMIKAKSFVYKRRERTKLRKKLSGLASIARRRKGMHHRRTTPYTLIQDIQDLCLPDQHPVVIWEAVYKTEMHKRLKAKLACFDFELFLKQVEKVYGKKEDSSNNLQRESRPGLSKSTSALPSS